MVGFSGNQRTGGSGSFFGGGGGDGGFSLANMFSGGSGSDLLSTNGINDFGSSLVPGGDQPGGGLFGDFNSGDFANYAQGATGLFGAYNSYNEGKQKEEFMKKSLAFGNRNLKNQSILTNQAGMDRVHVAAQMNGHQIGTPAYDAYVAANAGQVDGSKV